MRVLFVDDERDLVSSLSRWAAGVAGLRDRTRQLRGQVAPSVERLVRRPASAPRWLMAGTGAAALLVLAVVLLLTVGHSGGRAHKRGVLADWAGISSPSSGEVYARGVGDNKGQHFAQLLALESLLACRGALPCNVRFLLEGEEEVGSPHMPEFVREHRAEVMANLVITSDGPVHESGRSQILFGVRGILSFELRAKGANRDLHSGNWGGVAPNPLWTLVHLLATMKDAHGHVTIAGFYDNVLPLSELEREALARLPVDVERVKQSLDLRQLDQPLERGFAERLSAWPTFTINGLHGGYGGQGSKTVLPHEAFAKCDIRLVEAQSADEIFAKVVAHVRHHAPGVEVIHQGSMEPSKTPLDSPFTEPLRRAIEAAQGIEPLLVPAMGGSLPDYVFTKTLGIPAFVVPYANADEANHAPNENLEVERFFMGIKTGAAMLAYIAAM